MRGFTLIETVLYIALLGILMTSALLGSYSLIESTSRTSTGTATQEEGSFVRRKLEWAMAGMTTSPSIVNSGCNSTLSITKTGYPNPIKFKLDSASKAIQMCEDNSCTYLPITTNNVSATCLQVTQIPASGLGPSGVTVVVTLKQQETTPNPKSFDFTVTRYLRI